MSIAWIVTDDDAIEAGLTHKATLYGAPVYVREPYSDEVMVANKYFPLSLWTQLCDVLASIFVYTIPDDEYYELPLRNLKRLEANP